MRDKTLLRQLQALPLNAKVLMTQQRIREWYNHFNGNVFISFSGGKDSTVLTHLVHDMYPDVPLVFANTGLEYPEIQAFAKKMGAEFVRPKMSFSEVISTYGYPIISKEVAEAISFARRIVQQDAEKIYRGGYSTDRLQTDRTHREEKSFSTTNGADRNFMEKETTRRGSGEEKRSAKLHGRTGWRRANLTGYTPLPKKFCGGGVQEKSEESSEQENNSLGSSQFNKLKWLPLCNDTSFMISHYCCSVMKKSPMAKYQRRTRSYPFLGTMAEESRIRAQAWVRHGCNAFEGHKPTSQPMSFWTEQDVLHYILREGLTICSVYGDILAVDSSGMMYDPLPGIECDLKCTGCQRTGCVFCGFGAHLEKGETRFQRLARTHPKQYEYCMGGGQWVDNPKYDPSAPKMDGEWKNWNPKKIWVPSKEGLGMRKVFDDCNALYGKDFIRYE